MKKVLFSIVLLFCTLTVLAQVGSPEYMKEHYDKREVYIKMRDGVSLFTSIYEPKDKSVKHPVIMERTGYSVSPYGEDKYKDMTEYLPYVKAGYIFVFQDVRGKNMSEGTFENIRPFIEGKQLSKNARKNVGQTDEASDTYDTVEWLIHNTHSNGCVGQKGISYPGFYATMGALSGHPAMKAVSPQAPVTDWFHGDDVHHNGAFLIPETVSFLPYFEYYVSNETVRAGKSFLQFRFPDLFHTDIYHDYLNIGTYDNICKAYGDSLNYLRVIREHPNWDEYWETHTVTKGHMHDVKPAVMVVGGLFDKEDCYGAFDTYKSIKEQSPETDLYLVNGPWYHGAWSGGMNSFWGNIYFGDTATSEYYMEHFEYPFFAYYLEGKGEKPAEGAHVFDSGSRDWVFYPEGWPLVNRSGTTPFYLTGSGSIDMNKPSEKSVVSYVSDPSHPVPYTYVMETRVQKEYMIDDQRFASQRPDVLCFSTPALSDSLTIRGEVEVELYVDITTTDADFVVKVIDVYPDDFSYQRALGLPPFRIKSMSEAEAALFDSIPETLMAGYQLLVRGEVMRGKFRNSFSEPEPFVPGEVAKVRFTMPDVSHTFLPGHKLMVQVQSSWFPLVDRNPQTFCDIYTCDESAYKTSTISIHCSPEAASCVKLPVVK